MYRTLADILEKAVTPGGNLAEAIDEACVFYLEREYFNSLNTLHKGKVCKTFIEAKLSEENDGSVEYWEDKLREVTAKIDKVAKQVALLEARRQAAKDSES